MNDPPPPPNLSMFVQFSLKMFGPNPTRVVGNVPSAGHSGGGGGRPVVPFTSRRMRGFFSLPTLRDYEVRGPWTLDSGLWTLDSSSRHSNTLALCVCVCV